MIQLNEIIGYLPHGLKVITTDKFPDIVDMIDINNGCRLRTGKKWHKLSNCKPILLPPEAMSEEQLEELCEILEFSEMDSDLLMQFMTQEILWPVELGDMNKFYDYCHKNMINYRNIDALDLREYE
jgi:hypothetical protein